MLGQLLALNLPMHLADDKQYAPAFAGDGLHDFVQLQNWDHYAVAAKECVGAMLLFGNAGAALKN
jgi:hypothetical protein